MRSPVNRRDPTGTRGIEREEIRRQTAIIRAYGVAMAEVASSDREDKPEVLRRLADSMNADMADSTDEWMAKTERKTADVTDRVLNNLNTGIKLGNVQIPREEVDILKANIMENVRSVGDGLLKDTTRIIAEGYQNGWGADQITREINNATEGQVSRAETIVRTEILRVGDTLAKARYDAAGCDGYMSYPTDDDRTCPTCISYATGGTGTELKVYGLNEPMALPWHPNCRCCRIPHFEGLEAITI